MKKALWLVSWYPSRVDEFNGDFIQRHARAAAIYCNVDVIYVVKSEKRLTNSPVEKYGNLNEQIIYYYSPATGIRLLDRFLSQLKYKRIYRQAVQEYIKLNGKPDIVHVHIAMKAGLTALWIKRKWGVPFVVTENWTGYYKQSVPSVYEQNWYLQKMNKKVLKEAGMFLPVTDDLGKTVRQNFVDIPYKVIPNVVNTDLFYYKSFNVAKFRFIHFSYMNYQKNPEGILAATARLKEMGYDFELLMIGNNDKRLSEIAGKYGLSGSDVQFRSAIPYTEVASEMQKASVFLLFSRFENLPCVILEALCCGLPVISSKVGGIAEVLNEENGILVESEDTEQFAFAMKRMMDSSHLYNRELISEKAIEEFNYRTVGKQMSDQYNLLSPG